jgi:uncharacterized protein YndB with AHSA1/START domain
MSESIPKPQVGDEAVQAKTGRSWEEWFALLDAADAAGLGHKEIVALLRERHDVGAWWQQMITVTYEQARGLRQKHQGSKGFQIGASKTVGVPVETLFRAWHQEELRMRWLPQELVVRKATPPRSLRVTWSDGRSHVDVYLEAKGPDRSRVSLEHARLADAEEADRMKAYWGEALLRLKELLEAGPKGSAPPS